MKLRYRNGTAAPQTAGNIPSTKQNTNGMKNMISRSHMNANRLSKQPQVSDSQNARRELPVRISQYSGIIPNHARPYQSTPAKTVAYSAPEPAQIRN